VKFSEIGSGLINKRLDFAGDLYHHLDTGIVFQIHHYWEIRKVVSTDCTARRCSARHALAGIAIATMMSLRHWLVTDSHDRRALAEVCTVLVLLVIIITKLYLGTSYIDSACCYRWSSVVRLSVCLSVMIQKQLLGLRTWVGPGNHVLDLGPDPPWVGTILTRGEGAAVCKV